VCVVGSSVARLPLITVDNSGVYVYYLKGLVSVYARLATGYDYGFLWNTPYLYVQPTKLSDARVLPTYWLGGRTRGLQPGGHVHKQAVHLLPLKPASITRSGAF